MATWLVGHAPFLLPVRARFLPSRLWLQARSHLNIALQAPSPASLEIETMPYPNEHPDMTVFESMSEEYASVSAHVPYRFTPLSSSETLASLVLKGDFYAAESLHREMTSHHIPIPHDALYLRAALHAITARRPRGSAKERLDAFVAWLLLVPDRHVEWQSFHDIRQRLFRSMDHLNLTLVYRFGLVLASKGYYSGNAPAQVVSTLARYARPSVVEEYLRQVEDASREYHSKKGTVPPSDLLVSAYSLAVRTITLGGQGEAAFALISLAQSRGIRISDFTLNMVAKHASDLPMAIDRIRSMYPLWTVRESNAGPVSVEREMIPEHSADVAILARRLRSLRTAMRSPSPPSPYALHDFIISCQTLGRTHALTLLRSLAYSHSLKSASTWAFTEMLLHRSHREYFHVLFVFSRHFHPVGIPRKTLFSFIRGTQGRQALKERTGWVGHPCLMNEKLWPSAYHTALVWEAIVALSSRAEKERLYALLVSLVRRSRQQELNGDRDRNGEVPCQAPEPDRTRVELSPSTFDAVHFSPFVSSWTRENPVRAAGVLRDMVNLGVEPSMMQWSMVARGYAQHGDPQIALRILDRFEDVERGDDTDVRSDPPSELLLGVHTNVLRGFAIAGDVHHAREVERRLVERLGYRAGERPATDASIVLLRELEDRFGSGSSPRQDT